MSEGPAGAVCPVHGEMRRLYDHQKAIVILDGVGYHEKAYRGEELPAGMTLKQVRGIIDNDAREKRRGRVTLPRRGRVITA